MRAVCHEWASPGPASPRRPDVACCAVGWSERSGRRRRLNSSWGVMGWVAGAVFRKEVGGKPSNCFASRGSAKPARRRAHVEGMAKESLRRPPCRGVRRGGGCAGRAGHTGRAGAGGIRSRSTLVLRTRPGRAGMRPHSARCSVSVLRIERYTPRVNWRPWGPGASVGAGGRNRRRWHTIARESCFRIMKLPVFCEFDVRSLLQHHPFAVPAPRGHER